MTSADHYEQLERLIEEQERQTEALEGIAREARYQNAALVALIDAMDDLSARVDQDYHSEGEPRDRSQKRLENDIRDHLFTRDENEDESEGYSTRYGHLENWREDTE